MTTHQLGSVAMPIVISDDEDDEIQVIRQLQPVNDVSPPFEDIEVDSDSEDVKKKRRNSQLQSNKGYIIMLRMGYVPGYGLGRELDGDFDPLPLILKRQRIECGIGCNCNLPSTISMDLRGTPSVHDGDPLPTVTVHEREYSPLNPSSPGTPQLSLAHSPSPPLKRKRDQDDVGLPVVLDALPGNNGDIKKRMTSERLVADSKHKALVEAGVPTGPRRQASQTPQKMKPLDVCTPSCQDSACRLPHPRSRDPLPRHSSYWYWRENVQNAPFPMASGSSQRQPPLNRPFSLNTFSGNIQSPTLPSKPSFLAPPLPHPPSSEVAAPSVTFPAPADSFRSFGKDVSQRVPPTAPDVKSVNPPGVAPAPSVKKSQLPIGMPADANPYSTRGLFPLGSSIPTGDGAPYVPHSSRALVMESLPKKFRDPKWVKDWCTKACGAQPDTVRVDVDPKAGKALIELNDAELAQKAFNSPRLQGMEGLPGIRVWWFRPAAAEMEEGEIAEDDDRVHQIIQPTKKAKPKKKKKPDSLPAPAPERYHTRSVTAASGHEPTQSLPLEGFSWPPTNVPHFPSSLPPHSLLPFLQDPASNSSFHPSRLMTLLHSQGSPQPADNFGPQQSAAEKDDTPNEFMEMGDSWDLQYPDDGAEHDSIASSRAASPSQVDDVTMAVAVAAQDTAEDMEISSPISTQLTLQGAVEDNNCVSEGQVNTQVDETPGLTLVPCPPVALSAPVPQLPRSLNVYDMPPHILDRSPSSSSSGVCQTSAPQLPQSFDASHISNRYLPASSNSVTPSVSPPLSTPTPPSEPRAMKNAPTAPSYAKRSLIARQKELEERIARTKLELSKAADRGSVPEHESVIPDTGSGAAMPHSAENKGVDIDKVAMEMKLRDLVLRSKKNKSQDSIFKSETRSEGVPPQLDISSPDLAPGTSEETVPSSASSSTSSVPKSALVASTHDSFDDLAVSFITETIQTLKAPPLKPTPSSQKLELAAKQRRLEQQIADSKALMLKLNAARTKEEKDSVLSVMREQSRLMEEDVKSPALTATTTSKFLYPDRPLSRSLKDGSFRSANDVILKIRWPETRHDAGVLIVSDDENDD